jgi:hypothetical protein
MSDLFIKKYWDEAETWYYLHYSGEDAVRQIEISPEGKKLMTLENDPQDIADQPLSEMEYESADIITKEEFEKAWTI